MQSLKCQNVLTHQRLSLLDAVEELSARSVSVVGQVSVKTKLGSSIGEIVGINLGLHMEEVSIMCSLASFH